MTDQFTNVIRLFSIFESKYPHMVRGLNLNKKELGDNWIEELEEMMTLFLDDTKLEETIAGYVRFTTGIMMSQKRYELTGSYEYSKFEDVQREVYNNEQYVTQDYMPGLLLSHYLWIHHYRLLTYFRQRILTSVAHTQPISFCEVGVGTALYAYHTLDFIPDIVGVGYDISPSAIEFGKSIIAAGNYSDRFTFELRDVVTNPTDPVDFLICQEVLEHLENPQSFVNGLARLIKPGGHAYITAALTAGQIDHLYHFRSVGEIEIILENAGLIPLMIQMDGARSYNEISMRPRVAVFYCLRVEA